MLQDVDQQIAAGRELRRRGALSSQQEAALQELEHRAQSPAQQEPRTNVGPLGGVLRLTGLADRPSSREDDMFGELLRGRGVRADASSQERDALENRLVQRRLEEFARSNETESTPAEVEAYVRQTFRRDNPTPQERSISRQADLNRTHTMTGGLSRFGSGALEAFNLSDEGARLDALMSGRRGDVEAEAERIRLQRLRDEDGLAQFGREFVGAAPTMLLPAGQGLRGALASGGLFGAAGGAGAGETLEERAEGALVGGATGSLAAGGLYGVGRGADYLGRKGWQGLRTLGRALRNRFGGGADETAAQSAAVQRLQQAFADDGINAAQAEDAMRAYVQNGFDDAALLDVGGDAVRREVRRAAGTAGPASSRMEQVLSDRIESQPGRVGEQVARFISRDRNFRNSARQAVEERAQRAQPLYESAIGTADNPVTVPRQQFADILERIPARIMRRAGASSRVSGGRRNFPPALDGEDVSLVDMQSLKFALDDAIETGARGSSPLSRRELSQLRGLRQDLLDRMPQAYREANEIWAGDSAMIEAMRLGRGALRMDTEELAEATAAFSAAEKDMFRIGMVRAVREQAGNRADGGDVAQAILRNPNQRERLRAAFDSDDDFALFVDALRGESDRVRNARAAAASSGSQTAPREADQTAGGMIDFVQDVLSGNWTGPGRQLSRMAGDAVVGTNRRARDAAIVDMATRPLDEAAISRLLSQIEAEAGPEVAAQVRQLLQRSAAPVGLASGVAAAGQVGN